MAPRVLVLNPGSTSTKLALFAGAERVAERVADCVDCGAVGLLDQLPEREAAVLDFVAEAGGPSPDAVCGRGGPLRPLEGGTYAVDAAMLADLRSARYGEHASLLGGILAHTLAGRWGVPAYVVDPVTVDELDPRARLGGLPEVERSGRSHALNLKAVMRLAAAECGKAPAATRFVAAHLGGGISVAALRGGRIVDVNDALLGMGPFSPQRAGAMPLRAVLDLAFAPGAERAALERKLSAESGLFAYLGTGDLREVERRVLAGDEAAIRAFNAMAYQIGKEMGAMAAALDGDIDGLILTGGMSRCELLVSRLRDQVGAFGRIFHYPGEHEMEALAAGALRVLAGDEEARPYGAAGEGASP